MDSSSIEAFQTNLLFTLEQYATAFNVLLPEKLSVSGKFGYLIEEIGKRSSVVLLIDEYDKPIIDHLDTTSITIQ